ncbi:hypothetical protein ACFQNE_01940 [Gordonia phosphorivorans]|uniref:Uncharacterized protein n=1 Tax=Gordonia phosphorivorans TaxID=1056982 RepID=A0ABV6H6M3_9ACTN
MPRSPHARAMTGFACRLPARNADGSLGYLDPSVPIYLIDDGIDPGTGGRRWRIPSDAFPPGAKIRVAPLPPGDVLINHLSERAQ